MPRGKTQTKDHIIKTAKNLFASYGCEQTTLDDILNSANLTKGAFYHYFQNKDQLCEIVLDEVLADYKTLAENIDKSQPPLTQLKTFLQSLISKNESGEWVNCNLIIRLTGENITGSSKLRKKIRKFWQWYLAHYEGLLTQCRQKGQISQNRALYTQLHMLVSMLIGSMMLSKVNPHAPQMSRLPELLTEILEG
jgi:AcrR family transcriptional regulator